MEMVWDWKSITSLLATIVFIRTAARDFVPPELRHFLHSLFARIFSSLRPTFTFYIDEYDTTGICNELFSAAQSYLSSRCLSEARVLRLSKTTNSKSVTSSLPAAHSTTDVFEGVQMKWSFHSDSDDKSSKSSRSDPHRYFKLEYHGRRREMLHSRYLDHILEEDAVMKLKSRKRWLYTNRGSNWSSVRFHHPSTFDTLAIDPDLRDSIRNDLVRFTSRRDYYTRVGRAWKRGYLLHGPPGTGKTSLIAAVANFLKFDLYDLELTNVVSNTDLRNLLLSTSTKSVIVIEDIDCSLDLFDCRLRNNKKVKKRGRDGSASSESDSDDNSPAALGASLSLSGVLNFVDGLWSSCVGERLMIFTTNHPERLDPALLRPGRMDRKIHLSYCEPPAFRVLAKNYLEIDEEGHETMKEVEALLKGVKVTPADIAEVFMGCDEYGADVGLRKVVEELQKRKEAVMPLPLPPATAAGGEPEKEEMISDGAEEEEGVIC